MIKSLRFGLLLINRQKAYFTLLFFMLLFALMAYVFAGGQLNYSITGFQYFKSLNMENGYYIEAQSQENNLRLFYDELLNKSGVDSLIYKRMAFLKPASIEAVGGAEFQIYCAVLGERDIVHTTNSLNGLDYSTIQKNQIYVIVPKHSSFNIGDTQTVTLKNGEIRTIVAAAEYVDNEFFLNFESGGSTIAYQSLIGNSNPIFLWKDFEGDCINNSQYATVDGFLAYVVFDKNIKSDDKKMLRDWLISKGISVHDQTEMQTASLNQIEQLFKSTFAFPCFLLLISALMIINTTVLRVRRTWNKIAVFRLIGMSNYSCLMGLNWGVLILGIFTWLLVLISGILINFFRPDFIFERNQALINSNLYFTALIYVIMIIGVSGFISWALVGRVNLNDMLRRKE